MTTSDHPRADRRDDDAPEHRGLGQRILDAVLGDASDQRHDRTAGSAGAAHGEGSPLPDTAGSADPREATRDAGYDPTESAVDARRDAGEVGLSGRPDTRRDTGSGYADDSRRDAGYDDPVARAAGHEPADPGRDPLAYDAPHDLEAAGYEDHRPADRTSGYTAAPADAGVAGRSGAAQDFVTGSYDPDRDRGYDPQAAGTAVETDPAAGAVARNTNIDRGHDPDRDPGATDYDPAQDTGYVDASRAEADRTTGRRDDDYDTGRVDTGRVDTDRAATEPVDRDRDHPHRGAGTAAAAGAAAAAAFGSSDHDRSDRDRDADRDTRFSDVDDTATVDATDTGRSTPDTGDRAQAGVADDDGSSGVRERLVPADRADDYGRRWDALKGDFVDEPRRAVRQADELVGEVLDELQRLFADQRRDLEQSFDHDRASTEDLRLALRRYRSFFDRLLSF